MIAHIAPVQSTKRRPRIPASQPSVIKTAVSWTWAINRTLPGIGPPHACSARRNGSGRNIGRFLSSTKAVSFKIGYPGTRNWTSRNSIYCPLYHIPSIPTCRAARRQQPPRRPPDAAYFAAASAAMTSSLPEMVDRKGSATVSAASWASWFTEAQQSPTTTTL